MLIFNNKGARYTLELYCVFILFGTLFTIFFDFLFHRIFNVEFTFNTSILLNNIATVILVYFVPVYYYNKFKSINILFYINYAIILTILYTFSSVIKYNFNMRELNGLYLQELIFFVVFYINVSLFLTYYFVMLYSYLRKKMVSKQLVRYSREHDNWFM